MFKVGGTVLYGVEGVCTIKEITQREIGERKRQYYVLEPLFQRKSTVFVPTDNEKLASKMRSIVTRSEIEKIIADMPLNTLEWVDDKNTRQVCFKEIIVRGNCREVSQMAHTLHLRRAELAEKGKKLGATEERFLKTAEKMICDEFAVALGIEPDEVIGFIDKRLKCA